MNHRSRKLFGFLSFLFLIFAFFSGPAEGQEDRFKHPREMKFPPLSFHPPQPTRVILSNGMIVYLLENPELPLIRVSALIRTGSIYDPPDKSGLAKITATVLRNGGTSDQSPQAINEALERMAAEIEFSMERESGTGSLFARKEDFPQVLSIFAHLLMNPAFDPVQLDLAKKAEMEAIRRSNDDPEEIAYREFRKALYSGNPRGREPTLESVQRIEREDLIAFHRKFFQPNNLLLGISGDFKKEEMVESLEKAFAPWKRSLIEIPLVPLPAPQKKKSIYYAPKDLPQSTVLLGHLSLPLDHPDYFPFKILNFILGGGGFNSRLTQEIRSNRGLAYAVGSFYRGRPGYGVFGIFCQTKASRTHGVISLIYEIIRGMKENPPQKEELEWAKNSLVNQFIFSFTSSADVVWQRMKLEYDGLPDDYLEKYQQRLAAVTLEDVKRAAREHLHPERSVLLVVGKEEDFDRPLASLGPVQRIELRKYP